jgi:hypothetical protein
MLMSCFCVTPANGFTAAPDPALYVFHLIGAISLAATAVLLD